MSASHLGSTRRAVSMVIAATATLAGAIAVAPAASARSQPAHTTRLSSGTSLSTGLVARTILRGADLGLTQPDDLTRVGNRLFVAFQNGVPATGGTTGTPTQSTVVELTPGGTVIRRWQLTGKCDGLTADPGRDRLIATVNEDGNSALDTIGTGKAGTVTHYSYDANPLPHGGGSDSITVYQGRIFLAASAPSAGTFGPAVYEVTLAGGVAHLAAAPFYDSSSAIVANTGSGHTSVSLALTDPDSSGVVPAVSPRFAGQFMLTSQGDQQQVFASHLGTDEQVLRVLNLSQSVDDTAWATVRSGVLVTTDSADNTVVVIAGWFTPGTVYTAVTPANANTAPPSPGPNYLGTISLASGTVTAAPTTGDVVQPKGLLFLPTAGVSP
jgi:hypothetical protein